VDFVARCAQSAGVDLDDPLVAVDQRGMQHLVLIDHARRTVYRFPRKPGQRHQLQQASDRLRMLQTSGLPTPALFHAEYSDHAGLGHLVLEYLPGQPLDEIATDALPAKARSRLIDDLDRALAQIRALDPAQWPEPGPDWATIWQHLSDRAASVDLPTDLQRHHASLADAAAATAATVERRVFHGDLGGVNCRVDTATGAITGLLDWDSAAVGDPATDVAAVLAGLGPRTAEQLRTERPYWREHEQRYRAYLDTWPLQFALWSRMDGTEQDRRQALVLLTRSAAVAAG
jgi:aminoglycoside phosphotransferase (APT) family kinase protein